MNNNIANLKLESFFKSHKITKKASLGHFKDIVTEEDLKAISTMVHKMVLLPKYANIKNKLKSANGIVNFVTYDEFEPLVESIIRTSIPPNANDIYHMGQGITLPEDYFIDAKGFFGPSSSNPEAAQKALGRLETVIKGKPQLMTKAWLEDHGLDINSDSFISTFGEGAVQIRKSVLHYEAQMKAANESDMKSEIDDLFSKLDKDRQARAEIKALESVNKGKPDSLKKKPESGNLLSADQRNKIKKELRLKRGFYSNAINAIYTAAVEGAPNMEDPENSLVSILAPADAFSHEAETSEDGFLNWSPDEEIRKVYSDILDYISQDNVDADEMSIKLDNLELKLVNYRTTDPDLITKRQRILDFIVNDGSENGQTRRIEKFESNTGTFTRLIGEFLNRATQHGKVMIFKGVEDSAIASSQSAPAGGGSASFKLNNFGVLHDFIAANNANMVRDMQGEKKGARGKRTMIFVSSSPLQGMPSGSNTIPMDMSPVDEEEASIIVDSCIDAYVNEATSVATLKMAYDIESKYSGVTSSDKLEQQSIEQDQIDKILMETKTQLAYISPNGRKKIKQMLIGMGQKRAILKMKEVLSANVKYEKDADGILASVKFDEPSLLKIMTDEFSKEKAEDVPGLTLRDSKVKFANYITKKGSDWGDQVGIIAAKQNETQYYNAEIKEAESEIAKLDYELTNSRNLSPATKEEKLKIRDKWQTFLSEKILLRDAILQKIPHYLILRGKPGVGKCLGRGTKVMMADGSVTNVEDIIIGDELMGPDSKPRTVLNTTYGVGPLYRVDQKNGDSYVCNDAHILSLQNTDKSQDQDPIFISSFDFCKKNKTWKNRHKGWKVGVEFKEQDLPIDPYWMGLWLGDGISRVPSIMVAHKDNEIGVWLEKWAENNKMFIRKEKQRGCEAWHFTDMQGSRSGCQSNNIKTKLKNMDLLQNKHIPEIYLRNSSKNRLDLLAGLIDSDGYKSIGGSVQFTNVNKKLAEEVLYLARSLGLKASFAEGVKGIKKLNYTVAAYTVTLGGNLSRIPSRLTRKQGHDNPQKKSLRCGISVNSIGEGEYFGFEIDGDKQFLLGDFTVTHNSVWGDALADLFDFQIYQVDLSDSFDKWLGNSEKNAMKLLDAIFTSRNCVYLLDEIDRMMDMESKDSGGEGSAGGGHPVEKKIIAKFLKRFGDDLHMLVDRNVFVIMTTNHLSSIDNAMLKRAKGDVYEVEASDDPQDFLNYLNTFMETERKDNPNNPWISAGGSTTEEQWDYTMKYVRENIDLKRVAAAFAKKQLSFRSLSGLMQKACYYHDSFINEFTNAIARGDKVEPKGMPITTVNLLAAAEIANDSAKSAAEVKLGINEVHNQRVSEVRALWPNLKMEEIEVPHPVTGKMQKKFVLPREIIEVMEGKEDQEQFDPQFEVTEEEIEDPNDPGKKKRHQYLQQMPQQPQQPSGQQPKKNIGELADTGMEEDKALEQETVPGKAKPPQQEKIDVQKGKAPAKKKDQQGKVSSSTEYLYRFLMEKGVIDNNGIVTAKKSEVPKVNPEQDVPQKPQAFDSLEQHGTYYFNNGQILVTKIDDDVPPLKFYN